MGTKRAHGIDRVLALALQPWAITRPMVGIVARVLARRIAGDPFAFEDDDDYTPREPVQPVVAHGLAVIPVHGCIAPRINALTDFSGGTTFEGLTRDLDRAMADPQVKSILLDVDSPGGSVLGASEFARRVMAARTKKPITASIHFTGCSAAYWLASCATDIAAAPSASTGSIGVMTIHEDLSESLKLAGIKETYIGSTPQKTDGNPAEPLSDTARAELEACVMAHYKRFLNDVALGRGSTDAKVADAYGRGAVVLADQALAVGMVDRVATFEETVARLLPTSTAIQIEALCRAVSRLSAPVATAPAPSVDPPQEPAKATGTDRARQLRESQQALATLGL